MKLDITTLSTITIAMTLIALLVQRLLTLAVGASSFRTLWFFRGRLTDVKLALEHLTAVRRGALESIIDARVFTFMFGFHASRQLRDTIFGALESGLLSENQVKICSWQLTLDAHQKLRIKPSSIEIYELWLYAVLGCIMFAAMILLLLMLGREKQITLALIVLGMATSALCFIFVIKMLSSFLDIIIIRRTRNHLVDKNAQKD